MFSLPLPFYILLLVVLVILSVAFIRPIMDKRRRVSAVLSAITAEKARVANLPKLDTTYLLRIPGERGCGKGRPCTFGSRYNRLIINDENGDAWLGLTEPTTMKSLAASEFLQLGLWVPFQGSGEMYDAPPVTITEDFKIYTYPDWFSQNIKTNPWKQWIAIEERARSTQDFNAVQTYYPGIVRQTIQATWANRQRLEDTYEALK